MDDYLMNSYTEVIDTNDHHYSNEHYYDHDIDDVTILEDLRSAEESEMARKPHYIGYKGIHRSIHHGK